MDACILCHGKTIPFYEMRKRSYSQCLNCKGIQMDVPFFPSPEEEKSRYLEHNNIDDDPRYRQFLAPLVNLVFQYIPKSALGLDYGSGPNPVLSKWIQKEGYTIDIYDPFFAKNSEIYTKEYDYILLCEVAEHFHKPYEEFSFLRSKLKSGGRMFIHTDLYSENIDFKNWYYKNDQTHTFFYTKEGLKFIQKEFRFQELSIQGRLIHLQV